MKLHIDTNATQLIAEIEGAAPIQLDLYSREAFKLLSKVWITQQWSQLHWQSFSWFGFQLCQLPEDVLRLQEALFRLQPDVIIETGINNGGSTAFFASLCRLLGRGRVYSVDITIPAEVRLRLESGPFADLIRLFEADSADPALLARLRTEIRPQDKVFVFLDSDHSKKHVLRELDAYADLVTPGSYIVATDGVMESLVRTPYAAADWAENNPAEAAREFVARRSDFVIQRPECLFGEPYYLPELTYWPDAWLKRRDA